MAVTNYNSKSSSALGSAQDTLAYLSAVTAGSLLFVHIRIGTTATVSSVADSVNAGNWTLVGPTDNVGRQYFAYKENSGAGTPTVTLTLSASGQSPRWAVGEVTNTIGAGSFDASDILATGTGTAVAANAQSGATATYAHIGLASMSANETFSQSGSWTILGVEPSAGTSRLAVVYQEVTSAASRAPAVTGNSSTTWICFGFMVKQSSSGNSATGGVIEVVPVLAGAGTETFQATGTNAFIEGVPAFNASGSETFASASGAFTASAPSLNGSGTETFTASGTFTEVVPVLSGTGTETFSAASGTFVEVVPVFAASGSMTSGGAVTGSGNEDAQVPVFAASGTETFTGSGAFIEAVVVFSGTGAMASAVTGTGAVVIPVITLTGAGTVPDTAHGGGERRRLFIPAMEPAIALALADDDDELAALLQLTVQRR